MFVFKKTTNGTSMILSLKGDEVSQKVGFKICILSKPQHNTNSQPQLLLGLI